MNKNKKATSIIEAIVMILILLIWILGLFNIYTKSYNLSTSTKNKIEAIEIAREWIEAMENIRNTNWILLWADSKNCWNVSNYNNDCVWDNWSTHDITNWMYKIYTDANWRWTLTKSSWLTSKNYSDSNYRNFFRVNVDTNWLYTQSWWTTFAPLYTREINISYPEDTNWDWTNNSNDEKMQINSIVMWVDSHWSSAHIVDLESMLTNWKK